LGALLKPTAVTMEAGALLTSFETNSTIFDVGTYFTDKMHIVLLHMIHRCKKHSFNHIEAN
jgi:hypothetical protein